MRLSVKKVINYIEKRRDERFKEYTKTQTNETLAITMELTQILLNIKEEIKKNKQNQE